MRYTFLDFLGMNPLRPMIAFGGDDSGGGGGGGGSDDGGSTPMPTDTSVDFSLPGSDDTLATIDYGSSDEGITGVSYTNVHTGETFDNAGDLHASYGFDDDDDDPAPAVTTTPTYVDTSTISGISDASGVDYSAPDVEDPLDAFGGAGPDIGADDDYVESGVGYTYDPIVSVGTGTSGEDATPVYDPVDTSYVDTSSISGISDASGVDYSVPDFSEDNVTTAPTGVVDFTTIDPTTGDQEPVVSIDYGSGSDDDGYVAPVIVDPEPPAPPAPPPVYYDMFGNEYGSQAEANAADDLYTQVIETPTTETVTPTFEAGYDVDAGAGDGGADFDPVSMYETNIYREANVPIPESYMPTSEDFMPGITGTDAPRAEENDIRALYGLPPLETETDAIQTDLDELLGGGDDLVEGSGVEADELALELGLPDVGLVDPEEDMNLFPVDIRDPEEDANLFPVSVRDPEEDTGLFPPEEAATIDYGGRDFRDVAPDTSSTITNTIKAFEGFSNDTYFDVNAPRAGYGSDTKTDPVTGEVTKIEPGMTVTREEAEADLNRRLTTEFIPSVVDAVGADTFYAMDPATQAALTSIAYNYGAGWADKLPSLAEAARTGDNAIIADAIEDRAGDNDGINESRRLAEAEMVRSGATIDDDITSTVQGVVDTSAGAPASEITQIQEQLAAAIEPSLLEQGLALGARALIPGFGGLIADQLLTVGPEERQAIVDQHVRALERGATPLYDDDGNYTGFDRSTMGTFADEVLAADDISMFLPPTNEQEAEERADANQDGVPDVERFEEVFEAQQAAADADPYGLSTEEGFIMTGDDGQVGTEDDREFFVTSGGDVVEVRGDGEGEDRDIVDLDLNPEEVDQVINEVLGITEEEDEGDEPMNPCPEGYVLDPETNECVPIADVGEGEEANKPRFGDTERDLIRRELEEREAGEGLIIRKPKQFARGGPVDLDPNTYDFRGFDTDNPFDMGSVNAMLKHQVGLKSFDDSQLELYDLNRDGGIDTSDVTAGLQYINYMDDGVFDEARANAEDFYLFTPKMSMAARPTQELSTTVMPEPRPTTGAAGMSIGAPKQFAMGGVATPNIDKMLNTRRFAQGGAVTPNIDSFVRSMRG